MQTLKNANGLAAVIWVLTDDRIAHWAALSWVFWSKPTWSNWSSYQFICLMTWHPCPMLTDKTYSSHCSPLLSSVSHLLQVTEMKKAGWKWSWNSENAQEQCVNCVGRSGSVVKTCALIPTPSLLPGLFSLGKFPHSPASSSVTQTLNQLLPLDVHLIGGHSFFAGS